MSFTVEKLILPLLILSMTQPEGPYDAIEILAREKQHVGSWLLSSQVDPGQGGSSNQGKAAKMPTRRL